MTEGVGVDVDDVVDDGLVDDVDDDDEVVEDEVVVSAPVDTKRATVAPFST